MDTQLNHMIFIESLYMPVFTWIFQHTLFYTANVYIEKRELPSPNPVAINSTGVCLYYITNADTDYNAVSLTTLGSHSKDNQKNKFTWMHQTYSNNGKRVARNVYGPHNCRPSTLLTENNQYGGAGATSIRYIHVLN